MAWPGSIQRGAKAISVGFVQTWGTGHQNTRHKPLGTPNIPYDP